jgi:hypothetical protein
MLTTAALASPGTPNCPRRGISIAVPAAIFDRSGLPIANRVSTARIGSNATKRDAADAPNAPATSTSTWVGSCA